MNEDQKVYREHREIFGGVLGSLNRIGENFDRAIKRIDHCLEGSAIKRREIDALREDLYRLQSPRYH